MPFELIAAIVVIVVLLAIWIWLNAKWVRNQSDGGAKNQRNHKADHTATPETPATKAEEPTHDEDAPMLGTESAQHAIAEDEQRPEVAAAVVSDEETEGPKLEVVPPLQPAGTRVFQRPVHPFRLNVAKVPVFDEERWIQCFYRLAEDDGVLGWMAFHEDTVGASDRDYEPKFTDALLAYKRTLEDLRREVGISQIVETSIVGDEGKMWFLSAIDDVWIALFVDRAADVERLSKRLLSAGEPTES